MKPLSANNTKLPRFIHRLYTAILIKDRRFDFNDFACHWTTHEQYQNRI